MLSNCTCLQCDTPFYSSPSHIANGWAKFCSFACKSAFAYAHAADRFWKNVVKSPDPDGCWLWQRTASSGYGDFTVHGLGRAYSIGAHRFAWELEHGPIPGGMEVCHNCDVRYPKGDISYRRCVRNDHLFLGTHQENAIWSVKVGRWNGGGHHAPRGERNPSSKLTDDGVIEIRRRFTGARGQRTQLAREFGVTLGAINLIVTGVTWTHL